MLKKLVFTSKIPFQEGKKLINEIFSYFKLEKPIYLSDESSSLLGVQINVKKLSKNQLLEMRALCLKYKIDVNYLPLNDTTKKILIADMDSTIIQGESINELASYAGVGKEISEITSKGMNGEIDFEEGLRLRVKMLKGKSSNLFKKVIINTKLNSGAETLIKTLNSKGLNCYLVSGGFKFLTSFISKKLCFRDHYANDFEIKNDILTGNIIEPILDRGSKKKILEDLCLFHNCTNLNVIAVGDGANDLNMLTTAGLGVAYEGKEILINNIDVQLSFSDLSGILFLQGYYSSEFL